MRRRTLLCAVVAAVVGVVLQWEALENVGYHLVREMEGVLGVGLELGEIQEKFSSGEVGVVILGYKLHSDGSPWPLLDLRVGVGAGVGGDVVVFSGGKPKGGRHGQTEAVSIKKRLLTCNPNISEDRILLEENSTNTWDNAVHSLALLNKTHPTLRNVIIVTNKFHQTRSLAMFRKASAVYVPPYNIEAVATPYSLRKNPDGLTLPTNPPCPGRSTLSGAPGAPSSTSSHALKFSPNLAFDAGHSTWWVGDIGEHLEFTIEDATQDFCGYVYTLFDAKGGEGWVLRVDGVEIDDFTITEASKGYTTGYRGLPTGMVLQPGVKVVLYPKNPLKIADLKYLTSCTPSTTSTPPIEFEPYPPPPFRPWHYFHLVLPYATWTYELCKEILKEVVGIFLYTLLGKM